MGFDTCNHPLKIQESIGTTTPKMGIHLRVWGFILSLFCTLESMRCDPRVSLLARNLASPCLGREPKVKVAITILYWFHCDVLWWVRMKAQSIWGYIKLLGGQKILLTCVKFIDVTHMSTTDTFVLTVLFPKSTKSQPELVRH
jgi:hypothetical protein